MALPGGEESLPATFTEGNKEIPLDYTVNIMESDEFLHLLSEEESSEEQLKALHHCLESCPKNNGPALRVSSSKRCRMPTLWNRPDLL